MWDEVGATEQKEVPVIEVGFMGKTKALTT